MKTETKHGLKTCAEYRAEIDITVEFWLI